MKVYKKRVNKLFSVAHHVYVHKDVIVSSVSTCLNKWRLFAQKTGIDDTSGIISIGSP